MYDGKRIYCAIKSVMMKYWSIVFYIGLLMLCSIISFAQEEKEKKENRHYISITFAESYIAKGVGIDNLDHKGHFVPSFGLDYLYRFHPKFEAGIMFDYELGHYLIPHEEDLERENAIVLCGVVTYEVLPSWNVFVGGGIELEKHHNLGVFRIGTEYNFDLSENWSIPLGTFYDIKEGYDTWSISVGIGKSF